MNFFFFNSIFITSKFNLFIYPCSRPCQRVLTYESRSLRDDHILSPAMNSTQNLTPKWEVCLLGLRFWHHRAAAALTAWPPGKVRGQVFRGLGMAEDSVIWVTPRQGDWEGYFIGLQVSQITMQKHLAQCLTSGRDANVTASPIHSLYEMWILLDCPGYCPL